MAQEQTIVRWVLSTVVVLAVLSGCGLRKSALVTRPPGHVKEDAGLLPDSPQPVSAYDAAPGEPRRAVIPDGNEPGIDCQGTEEQVNDCIINAPTKSGLAASRAKPTITYQTCGAQ